MTTSSPSAATAASPIWTTTTLSPPFEHIFEETRARYGFEIHAYVVMPEHVHLLVSEPDHTRLATAINVLKFRSSKLLKGERKQFWQTRYHDRNILSHRQWLNALRYIHQNPVTRGLVPDPEDWPWSSYTTGSPANQVHCSSRRTGQPHARVPHIPPRRCEAPNYRATP